jgi:hypothetical protein
MTQDQEFFAERLSEELATMDIPRSTVDVSAVMRTGRARARRRHTAGTAAAVALVLLAVPGVVAGWRVAEGHGSTVDGGPTAAAPPDRIAASPSAAGGVATTMTGPCRITALPVPSGAPPLEVTDADPSGRYVIAATSDGRDSTAHLSIRWDGTVATVIPVGGTNSVALAVNASGVVVGWGDHGNSSASQFPWTYREGRVSALPLPVGYPNEVHANGINAAGDVVGTAIDPAYSGKVALLWPADQPGTVRVLPMPALPGTAKRVRTVGVAEDGSVVATIGDPDHTVAYRWGPDGKGGPLAVPDGVTDGWVAAVRGWQAFGGVSTGAAPNGVMPTLTPARWDLRTGEVELLDPQVRGQAVDGNVAGDVIVEDSGGQRVLLHDRRRVSLDALTPASFLKPAVVAESGVWLAGTDYEDPNNADGKRLPVLWLCSPS